MPFLVVHAAQSRREGALDLFDGVTLLGWGGEGEFVCHSSTVDDPLRLHNSRFRRTDDTAEVGRRAWSPAQREGGVIPARIRQLSVSE